MTPTLSKPTPDLAGGWFSLLREDIRCVFHRDPAARSSWEVFGTYPGVHAVMVHRVSHSLWNRGWRLTARALSFLARMTTQIDIHPGARIGRRFFIDHGCGVVIGETAVIGDDVTLYHGVTLGGTSWNVGKRHPTLGDGVMVGAGAKILGPITVNRGARVGANSVVIKDVPEGMTVVGVPGRVVRLPERRTGGSEERVELDHHLLPDPVEKITSALVDRITSLEADLARVTSRLAEFETDGEHCVVGNGVGKSQETRGQLSSNQRKGLQ